MKGDVVYRRDTQQQHAFKEVIKHPHKHMSADLEHVDDSQVSVIMEMFQDAMKR